MKTTLGAASALSLTLLAVLSACHREPDATHATAALKANEKAKETRAKMDTRMVTKLTKAQPAEWYQAGERPIFLADVLDETSGSPMSVGFARYGAGASNDWTVTYDEVLIITKGVFTVRAAGNDVTARAGEAIFLPKGTPLTYRAEEAAELVYVTYPHWAAATRSSEHAAALDAFHPVPPAATAKAR